MTTNELTIKARSVARCLSYNDDKNQAAAKHLLLELSHRLDSIDIRAHKNTDGLMLINGIGQLRYATISERIIFKLRGVLPKTI